LGVPGRVGCASIVHGATDDHILTREGAPGVRYKAAASEVRREGGRGMDDDGHGGWLADTLITALRDMDSTTAYLSILGMLGLCGLGLPMPEDIILISAGFLSSLGKFSLPAAIGAGMVGVLSGDAMLFFLGRRYGRAVFRWPLIRRMFPLETQAKAEARIVENGAFICFMARFLPGLRSPIYLMAGAMGITPRTYIVQDGLAASISVPFWVLFGWYFGDSIEYGLHQAGRFQWVFFGVALLVIAIYTARKWRAIRSPAEDEEGGA
jgi:membrane protein DedA with SNARE-associated domain